MRQNEGNIHILTTWRIPPTGRVYRQFTWENWTIGFGNCRSHHPEIPIGVLKLCFKGGVQFFAGRFLITFSWPLWLHR